MRLRVLKVAAVPAMLVMAVFLAHPWAHPVRPPRGAPAPSASPPPQGLLPTGLGPLVPPATGAHLVDGFGWVQRAGRPVFQPYSHLRVAAGAGLVAVAPGVVAAVRDDPAGPGLYLLVDHDRGWASLYGGCGTVLVRTGQRLRAGDAVCRARTGPVPADVAFGLLQAGEPVDPAPYVSLR